MKATGAAPRHIAAEYWLPEFHVRSAHQSVVNAPLDRTWAALLAADFSESRLVRTLMRIRGYRSGGGRRASSTLTEAVTRSGFIELAHEYHHQLVFGLVGQFWRPTGGLCARLSPVEFDAFAHHDFAKATWSFCVQQISATQTLLATETRVAALSPAALRKFKAYWFFVGPFSGMMRREMLRIIARHAESASPTKS